MRERVVRAIVQPHSLAERVMVIPFSLLILAWSADPALAHHAMGGVTPTTFWHGLLSGLAHPVIGLDHLAAVIAVGCLAATQPQGRLLALAYVAASLLGAGAHIGEKPVPNAEVFVALAVVALGLMLFRASPLRRDVALALFAGAGLVNGYALGETIAGALPSPIVGYFAGLALVQTAIALAAMSGLLLLAARPALNLLMVRAAGAFAVGAGVAVILQRYVTGA
jgi:urease accessory protein